MPAARWSDCRRHPGILLQFPGHGLADYPTECRTGDYIAQEVLVLLQSGKRDQGACRVDRDRDLRSVVVIENRGDRERTSRVSRRKRAAVLAIRPLPAGRVLQGIEHDRFDDQRLPYRIAHIPKLGVIHHLPEQEYRSTGGDQDLSTAQGAPDSASRSEALAAKEVVGNLVILRGNNTRLPSAL